MCLIRTFAVAALCAALFACGTPGAPRPPSLQLPRPVEDLAATRKGDKVTLTWTPSTENTDGTLIRNPGPTRACRGVNEFPLAACSQPVGDVPTPAPLVARQREKVSHVDTLPKDAEQQAPMGMVTYVVEMLNRRGRSAGLSNQVRVPLAPAPPPPGEPNSEVRPEGVLITVSAEERYLPAGVQSEYRLFRRDETGTVAVDLGAAATHEQVGGSYSLQFIDHSVEWEKTYFYHVTPVVTVTQDSRPIAQFQGDDSPEIKVFVHDIFPPAAPVGLQAVFSGVGQKPFIDLTWASNQEADLAGYNVFRGQDGGEWTRINRELVAAPAFRDTDVASGHTYHYTVTAVDLRGNESQRSAETSEAIPLP